MVLFDASILTPAALLPRFEIPSAAVPIKFPCTRFPVAAEPPIKMPRLLFPDMTFRAFGDVPPIELSGESLTEMAAAPFGILAVPAVFVPMRFPCT